MKTYAFECRRCGLIKVAHAPENYIASIMDCHCPKCDPENKGEYGHTRRMFHIELDLHVKILKKQKHIGIGRCLLGSLEDVVLCVPTEKAPCPIVSLLIKCEEDKFFHIDCAINPLPQAKDVPSKFKNGKIWTAAWMTLSEKF